MARRVLTVDRHEEIKRRLADGRSLREIATALGCSRRLVRQIRDGERLTHETAASPDPLWMSQLEWPVIIHELGLGFPMKFIWDERAKELISYPNFWKQFYRKFRPLSVIRLKQIPRPKPPLTSNSIRSSATAVDLVSVAALGHALPSIARFNKKAAEPLGPQPLEVSPPLRLCLLARRCRFETDVSTISTPNTTIYCVSPIELRLTCSSGSDPPPRGSRLHHADSQLGQLWRTVHLCD